MFVRSLSLSDTYSSRVWASIAVACDLTQTKYINNILYTKVNVNSFVILMS